MSCTIPIVFVVEESDFVALAGRYESLSTREREVMAGVVSGMLNKWVGASLGISEITVKAHRCKLMRKMQAGSLADLVRMGMLLRLTPADTIAKQSVHIPGGNIPSCPTITTGHSEPSTISQLSPPVRVANDVAVAS
jgi:DNA-binding CsgD family transcriptional regulator